MIVIKEKLEENLVITEDIKLNGILTGNVEVFEPGKFYIHGIVNGNILIHENSMVFLHGIVNGRVINDGGDLEIYGILNGKLFSEKGQTLIDKSAIIEDK